MSACSGFKLMRRLLAASLGLIWSLGAPVSYAQETVVVETQDEAESAGFFEPIGDYSDGNLSGSRAQGDSRGGGDSALVMALSSGSPRATVAYRSEEIKTKQDVLDLGAINFDYFASASLVEASQDLSLKIRCSNNLAITHSFPQGVQTESWVNKNIDLSTAPFYRGDVTQSFADWVSDTSWCHGKLNRVSDLQIGAGSNAGIDREAQVYLDYLQFGEASNIHNFELPPEAPVQQGTIIDAIMGGGMV